MQFIILMYCTSSKSHTRPALVMIQGKVSREGQVSCSGEVNAATGRSNDWGKALLSKVPGPMCQIAIAFPGRCKAHGSGPQRGSGRKSTHAPRPVNASDTIQFFLYSTSSTANAILRTVDPMQFEILRLIVSIQPHHPTPCTCLSATSDHI